MLLLLALSMTLHFTEVQGQRVGRGGQEKLLFGRTLHTKQKKVREPKSVQNAKKKQEANKKKQDKEFEEYVKASRKRAVKIQSPEVQDRMIENRKEADKQYKAKRKKAAGESRKTGRKYRR